jgi:hypothetical protein
MDREFYTDNFEQLLREEVDKFTMKPTQRVWQGIYNDLHPGRRWPSIAISLLLVGSILLLGYFNTDRRKIANHTTAALSATDKARFVATTGTTGTTDAVINTNGKDAGQSTVAPLRPVTTGSVPADVAPGTLLPGNALLLVTPVIPSRSSPRRTSRHSSVMALQSHGRQAVTVQPAETGVLHNDAQADRNAADKRNATDSKNNTTDNNLPEGEGGISTNGSMSTKTGLNQQGRATITGNQPLATSADMIPEDADNLQPGVATVKISSQQGQAIQGQAPAATTAAEGSTSPTQTQQANVEKNKSTKAQAYQSLSDADKAWIDHYALYNKRPSSKWKNKLSWQVYLTPSVSYRTLFENSAAEGSTNVQSLIVSPFIRQAGIENSVEHKAGLGFELGGAVVLQASKKWQFRLGTQLNYTSYYGMANEVGHPINTSIALNNLHTGGLQLESRSANISNTPGSNAHTINNYTVQLSLPVGFAYKLAGKDALKFYAGASLQPSIILAGSSPLLSSDRLFYVENNTRDRDNSLMRNFNLAIGLETFASYRLGDYTLSAGPQLRYQLLTTNSNRYTIGEKAYSIGLRLGISKQF